VALSGVTGCEKVVVLLFLRKHTYCKILGPCLYEPLSQESDVDSPGWFPKVDLHPGVALTGQLLHTSRKTEMHLASLLRSLGGWRE